MAKKKYEPCHPLEYAKRMADDGTAPWLQDLSACEERVKKAANGLLKDGWIEREDEAIRLSHTTFTVADWLKSKQCYTITKELADSLFTMDDLTFPVHALNMPFRTIYLDWENLEDARNQIKPLGVFIMIGDVPYGKAYVSLCSVVTLAFTDGEYVFGGISFDYFPDHMEMSLMELITELTKDFEEERPLLIKALLFAAYLSSEKPDIVENEAQKAIHRPSTKHKYSSVRKWEVGVRYASEQKKRETEAQERHSINGRRPPRPHMRKAHWQVYRIGPGRKQKKVLWIPPVAVGVRNTDPLPVVIREKKE